MMKNLLTLLFVCISTVASFGQAEEVKAAFETYKTAMVAGNVDDVISVTAQESFEYYEMLIDYALHADSTKVAALPLIDRMSVLGTRLQIPKENLSDMDGAGYIRYGLENNMTNTGAMDMMNIGDVSMDGTDKASGQVVFGAQVMPVSMDFVKESGKWKFDATSMIKLSEGVIQQSITNAGMTENDFIMSALQQVKGSAVDNSVWQPLDK